MMQPDVPGTEQPRLFEQSSFEETALQALTELQQLVIEKLSFHELEELQSMTIWKRKLPSFKDDALSILFDKFEGIDEQFDPGKTRTELCTFLNLTELTQPNGPQRVTNIFRDFFESRAFQVWSVLIPLEKVRVLEGTTEVRDDLVQLRSLTTEERAQLATVHATHRADGLFFATSARAGDAQSAVALARMQIDVFLAPYYLHRMRNPDDWRRARTSRQIVSPVAFYSNSQGLFGAARELRELATEVHNLFTPDPPIQAQWKRAIEQLAESSTNRQLATGSLGERLRLCSRWMFSAESDELPENAFLKHAIAWEALMPSKAKRARKCWYLLLLCLSTADPLCVETISQASRLVDRRNSFAHPEIEGELYGTVESNLTTLKQSVWWGFDQALRLWQSPGGVTTEWGKLLSDCYKAIRSDGLVEDYDPSVYVMLDRLQYVEENAHGKPALSRSGQCLRVEALITRARELWPDNKNPKESVSWLAKALKVATDEKLPPYEYHTLLTIEERQSKRSGQGLAEMDRATFDDGWQRAGVAAAPPTAAEISQRLKGLEHDFGVTRECVGWKKQ